MGIQRLHTAVQNAFRKQKGKFFDLLSQARKERSNGKPLIIAVDGLYLCLCLLNIDRKIHDILMPDYNQLHSLLIEFIGLFSRYNIKFRWYFAGSELYEFDELSRIKQKRIEKITWLTKLCNAVKKQNYNLMKQRKIIQFSSLYGTLLEDQAITTILEKGQDVVRCLTDVDIQLSADVAASNSDLFAVSSNDAEFYVTRRIKFIPIDSLVIQLPSDNKSHLERYFNRQRINGYTNINAPLGTSTARRQLTTIRCQLWTADKVADVLGLQAVDQLTSLAALCGNNQTKEFVHGIDWKVLLRQPDNAKIRAGK